jgi:hypothetical protein
MAGVTVQPQNTQPSASERSQWVSYLVAKGFQGQELAAIIRAGRTRRQIADDLRGMLKG